MDHHHLWRSTCRLTLILSLLFTLSKDEIKAWCLQEPHTLVWEMTQQSALPHLVETSFTALLCSSSIKLYPSEGSIFVQLQKRLFIQTWTKRKSMKPQRSINPKFGRSNNSKLPNKLLLLCTITYNDPSAPKTGHNCELV